ncbi:zinc-ribbon domain-containing protein [Actinoplanes sp. NPDC051494]|uniref:zinc-ribbon domain-containing protein n=1 Tax=Actinoplanes sp. NPDC051494 TaxID=3363907 RepID=UPI00379C5FE3
MFLLFGLRTKDHLIASGVMTCAICGWEAAQALYKRSTKFTLFFVPLFPVRSSRYLMRCSHCQGLRDASADSLATAVR